MSLPSFAVSFDYRCPFAKNIHLHAVTALQSGADLEIEFSPWTMSQNYRSEGAQRVGGSGLGLYLIAGLARMVGGSVTLRGDSPPGEVVFELWLPA